MRLNIGGEKAGDEPLRIPPSEALGHCASSPGAYDWLQCRVFIEFVTAMLEVNPILNRIKDLHERAEALRGYL
ncbi:MAG: hypothetical protein PHI49_11155 [Halothiobacillaceae bacterium]|jgi:hypothetical protein|nr:hypothetical protein [Halothiobacillaceae bacterium]MDY0050384.1 hypothetical protein [Halothiobacillaceae bacterium]